MAAPPPLDPALDPRLHLNLDGCAVDDLSFCGGVQVAVDATMPWDDFVAAAVTAEWVGVEALSGLPGTVADLATTNSRAFSQRPSDTIASVRTRERPHGIQRTFALVDCGYTRPADPSECAPTSRFAAGGPDSALEIVEVSFLMRQGDLTAPITDPDLAALLNLATGSRAPLARVRAAVLASIAAPPREE